MKTVFSYCKFFIIWFFSCWFICSCVSRHLAAKDRKKIVIKIISSDSTTGKLTMIGEDGNSADTLQVWSGQKVKWEIGDTSHVKSIKNIYPKPSKPGDQIYEDLPAPVFLSKSWKG